MSITFLSNPIHLPEFFKFDREYLGKQESQNEDQKVFHKDLVIVPFSAFENPKTSAVSLLCLAAGAGTALLFSMLGEM